MNDSAAWTRIGANIRRIAADRTNRRSSRLTTLLSLLYSINIHTVYLSILRLSIPVSVVRYRWHLFDGLIWPILTEEMTQRHDQSCWLLILTQIQHQTDFIVGKVKFSLHLIPYNGSSFNPMAQRYELRGFDENTRITVTLSWNTWSLCYDIKYFITKIGVSISAGNVSPIAAIWMTMSQTRGPLMLCRHIMHMKCKS